jgi:hypothetical protein
MDLCYSFPTFLAVSILFGFSLSAWPAVTSSMLVSNSKTINATTTFYNLSIFLFPKVDLLGLELLTSAFGVLTCIRGAAAFLGPPLGGFVIDMSGS